MVRTEKCGLCGAEFSTFRELWRHGHDEHPDRDLAAWGDMRTPSFDVDESVDGKVASEVENPLGERVEPDIVDIGDVVERDNNNSNVDDETDDEASTDVVEALRKDDTPVQSDWIAFCETCDEWWRVHVQSDHVCNECDDIVRAFRERLVHDEWSSMPVTPQDLEQETNGSGVTTDENGVPIIRDVSAFVNGGEGY